MISEKSGQYIGVYWQTSAGQPQSVVLDDNQAGRFAERLDDALDSLLLSDSLPHNTRYDSHSNQLIVHDDTHLIVVEADKARDLADHLRGRHL